VRARLQPQTGTAFLLSAGDVLRVIDPEGEQVADLVAFSREIPTAWVSAGRSFDYNDTIYLTAGHVLYSNRSAPMLTIVEDQVGRHDFLYTPCSAEMFARLYGVTGHHPSCFENLASSLAPHGIHPDAIPTTFNIFMNVDVAPDGRLSIHPPRSRAGDAIELRAEMDLLVGLTACSAELSNNHRLKPIDFEIRRRTIAAAP
jgi:uncharacterized protein YcgI (DUF1989 family)